MIVFDLECFGGVHRFEGWFKSSEDFACQQDRGLVLCPQCGSADVAKAPMAPRLTRKGNQVVASRPSVSAPDASPVMASPKLPTEVVAAMHALAAIQAESIKSSRWVGDKFAAESRAMHYGDADQATIHGQATREEARDLLDEGIMIVPLVVPIAPPDEIN